MTGAIHGWRRKLKSVASRPYGLGHRWRLATRTIACFCVSLALSGCDGREHLSFLRPQGPIAATESHYFWLVVLVLFILVALPVFVGTAWIAWRYRYGATRSTYAPRWKFYKPLEYFTWGGPVVIVLFLSILVWRNTKQLDPYHAIASNAPTTHIQVIGYDWKWLFVYPNQGIATVGVLAFPAAQPLSLKLTSATVMQSFFIPALGSQIYAMGGMVTQLNLEADRPGRFLGENTMYSGDGFHQQKFSAVAMTPTDFKAWVRRVRHTGRDFDATALKAIAGKGTRRDLRTMLPRAAVPDGALYFTGVKPDFFSRLARSVMAGKPATPAAVASTHTDSR